MRYELKKNKNGMITQCETNADGGNIYARREEINKQAIANLERPTPGKLGVLSNLQVFNFNLSSFSSDTSQVFFGQNYNQTVTTGNVTDCVMFGVDSINNKAKYYNVVDIKSDLRVGSNAFTRPDSYIQFYPLENIDGSTTSLGRKIPRRAPINGTSSGTITFTTTGGQAEYQSTTSTLGNDSVSVTTSGKGIRCSGIALKRIQLNFDTTEDLSVMSIDVYVYVDITSVSSTY